VPPACGGWTRRGLEILPMMPAHASVCPPVGPIPCWGMGRACCKSLLVQEIFGWASKSPCGGVQGRRVGRLLMSKQCSQNGLRKRQERLPNQKRSMLSYPESPPPHRLPYRQNTCAYFNDFCIELM